MQELTAEGRRVVGEVADRHGFSTEAVTTLLHALVAGNGTMAQFDHPELGGMGQWSQGGMVMIGDMFNNALKHRVDAACIDLAREIEEQPLFGPPAGHGPVQAQTQTQGGTHRAQAAGYGHGGSGASMVMPSGGTSSTGWWPAELGSPSSTGAQNELRYACFPQASRLAVDVGGRVTVYDTGDHRITGFSQQQGGDASISFTSQHGPVRLTDLAIVAPVQVTAPPPAHVPAPDHGSAPVFRPTPVGDSPDVPRLRTGQYVDPPSLTQPVPPKAREDEIFATIERLAGLKQKGILSDEEFAAKKAELLARL